MPATCAPSRRIPLAVVFACASALAAQDAATVQPRLHGVHRIVVLGDSITYAGDYVDWLDACLTARAPDAAIEVINLGLPSETVAGLSEDGHAGGAFPRPVLQERLARVLAQTKPDLVLACYGMNDGIYLPFAEDRFAKFRAGTRALHDAVTASGARVIHVTPPTFDETKGGHPGYGAVLDRYADWLLAQRANGWDVADVHGPMRAHLAAQRVANAKFTLADDGVHPNATGHWLMARALLAHLGAAEMAKPADAAALLASLPEGESLRRLVHQRQVTLRDAWLTAIGHQRPGLGKGLPLTEAQAKAATLTAQIRALGMPSPDPRASGKDSIATTSTATTGQHHARLLMAATLQPRHPAASHLALRRPAVRPAPGVADLEAPKWR